MFETNLIMFMPHLDMFIMFVGFLINTKMKADTKMTVIIRCLQRHLAVISAGVCRRGRPVDKIKNFEDKKLLVNCMLDSFGVRGRTSAHGFLRDFH